jgi:hypothetical protein
MAKINRNEFAVEQEAAPGTVETFVEADVLVHLRDGWAATPEHEIFDLEEQQSVGSRTPAVTGVRSIPITAIYNLRGPGDLVTAPAIQDLLEASLFTGTGAKSIAIGAIAGGPYVAGEVITGGTSAGTGLVLQQIATGTTPLYYLPITGTLQTGEVLTGSTSAATCTTSGVPADAGMAFRPADWTSGAGHHCSCRILLDGQEWTSRGNLADLSIALAVGRPAVITQNFLGAYSSHADVALFGVTDFPEAAVSPPKLLDAGIYIGTYQPTGVMDLTINWPLESALITDANDSAGDGVLYTDARRGLPTITMTVDHTTVANKDYITELQADTVQRLEFTLGSTTGSIWTFSAPAAQLRSIGLGSREAQRATFNLEFGLTGTNNEELLIWQH